jgi:hypothetical protein
MEWTFPNTETETGILVIGPGLNPVEIATVMSEKGGISEGALSPLFSPMSV